MPDSASERKSIESIRESGIHGGIGTIPDPEDIELMEEQGNIPSSKEKWKLSYKPSKRGPVEVKNETDDLFDNPEAAPVDSFLEAKRFLKEKYPDKYDGNGELFVEDVDPDTVKEEYDKWKTDEDGIKEVEKPEGTVTLDRSDVPEYLAEKKWVNERKGRSAMEKIIKVDDARYTIESSEFELKHPKMETNGNELYQKIEEAKKEIKPKKGVSIDVEPTNPVAEYWEELREIWNDPNAGVAYKFNKNPRKDAIVFVSGGKILAIPVANLNETFKAAKINREIRRPSKGDRDKAILDNFQSLKIGGDVFKGNKFVVEYAKKENKVIPKKPEIPFYKNTESLNQYNLRYNDKALERLVKGAEGEEKTKIEEAMSDVKEFIGILEHGKGDIEAFGFETNGRKLETVVIQLKSKINSQGVKLKGMELRIPADFFAKAWDIWHYSDKDGWEGYKYYAGGDKSEFVTPKTPERILDKIMLEEVSFNGVRLDSDVHIWKGPAKPPTENEVKEALDVPTVALPE